MGEKNAHKTKQKAKTNDGIAKKLFSRKYETDERFKVMIKQPKFWGALLGELIGTMLLTIAFMFTIGVFRADLVPLFMFGGIVAIYVATYAISGAQLNPLITAGAMATRRMSVVRGIAYILAQFAGAWLGFLLITMFKIGSGTDLEVPPSLIEVTGESFWAVALIELMGAVILGFMFARLVQSKNRSALTYALVMTCSVIMLYLFGAVISQNYYALYANLVFNPASASAYSIFSNLTGGFGQVMLILLAYFILPMVGGVLGCYIADLAKVLVGEEYSYDEQDFQTE